MQQMFPCSNCGVPVPYGRRFCGNCGITIFGPQQRIPQQQAPYQYGNQYQQAWGPPPSPNNWQGWDQQLGWSQSTGYNQPPGWGTPNQYQPYLHNNQFTPVPKKGSGGTIACIFLLILLLFGIAGFGLITKGTFSFSLLATNQQASSTAPADSSNSSSPAQSD